MLVVSQMTADLVGPHSIAALFAHNNVPLSVVIDEIGRMARCHCVFVKT